MGATKHNFFSVAAVGLALLLGSPDLVRAEDEASEEVALAVIINAENPTTNLKFRDLRKLLRVDKQYWEKRRRCVLYLPPTASSARTVLLARVFRMTEKELRRYWVTKVFSGDIPREPSVARTARAAGILVGKSEGGLSIVLATEVPKGVKVLKIDGKKPGDEGYALLGKVKVDPDSAADVKSQP